MKKNKNKFLIILSLALITGVIFSHLNIQKEVVDADAQVLPPNVNITDRSGTEIASYYSAANGLSGDKLLQALNSIIDDHREYNFDNESDRTAYKIIDRNWQLSDAQSANLTNYDYENDNPFLRKFYADYNDSKLTADRFKNDGATRVSFDREHLWAQSRGFDDRNYGAGSDFHHLVAADVRGNQQGHSNYNYGVPTSKITTVVNDYGTYVGRYGNIAGETDKVFEPLDEYKGDIARAMFYMPARYYFNVDADHPKLVLVNGSPSPLENPNAVGDLETLLAWHELDPVDEYEIHRNNLIYNNFQLNRNPFIDYPELAKIAFDTSYTGPGANISSTNVCLVGSCPYYDPTPTAELTSISITNPANINNYFLGETLDTTGLEITAHFSDNSSQVIVSPTISLQGQANFVLSTSGEKIVTISFTNEQVTKYVYYSIYVADSLDTTLTITPSVTTFKLGETYADEGLTAKVVFETINGQFERVAPSEDLVLTTTPDTAKLGDQTGQISYGTLSNTFSVKVTNQDVQIGTIAIADDLFFSEYIEGSSNNKAVELYNGTSSRIYLTGYTIKSYVNGAITAGNTYTPAEGSYIEPGDVWVIYNSSSVVDISSVGDATAGFTSFNGNDVIELYKDGVAIDIIGQIGVETNFAENVTLVRKPEVFSGKTTYDPSEWDSFPSDTFTYLGSHTVNWVSQGVTVEEQALAYAEYFRNITGPYCEDSNIVLTIPWTDLKSEYNYMSSATKDLFITSTDATIIDARARYLLLVERYTVYANDDFMVDGSGNPLLEIKGPATTHNSNNETLVFLVILGLSVTSITGYYFYRKRQIQL